MAVEHSERRWKDGRHAGTIEEWVFSAWTPDGSIGAVSGHRIVGATSWYWAALARPGRPLLHITDFDVPVRADPFIVKGEAMWAEHFRDDPMQQWSVGNETYAASFDTEDLPLPPAKGVAVVACMDARLNVYGLLGLREGDAHVIRNAGGIVTADELRSLAISQRLLGTTEIILIHHTDCAMLTFTDDEFRSSIAAETGLKPVWAAEAFTDVDADVTQNIARIQADTSIPHKDSVRGFVYDVTTGQLRVIAD